MVECIDDVGSVPDHGLPSCLTRTARINCIQSVDLGLSAWRRVYKTWLWPLQWLQILVSLPLKTIKNMTKKMSLRFPCISLLCFVFLALVYGQTCPNQTGQRLFLVRSDQAETCYPAESISGFPALIEVTLEDLETGLEGGLFTSVDLVNVG